VGKSSDTPKECKNRKTGRSTTGTREARGYGAGCVYNHQCYPGIMITIQLDDQDDIIELALMLQQILHECGVCNCEDPLPKRGD
jgi:hypothetical protein